MLDVMSDVEVGLGNARRRFKERSDRARRQRGRPVTLQNSEVSGAEVSKVAEAGAGAPALASPRPLVSRLYKCCPLCALLH